ncbi:MAG: hypothetical protein IPG88_26355 [Gemmatimonadetes bacterium]|nr:hypothetical protein [Gemmatimonadota bacterium]
MITRSHKRWISRDDFTSSAAAREDEVGLADSCWVYLNTRATGEFEAIEQAPRGDDTRLLADLVAASIQVSVQRRAEEFEGRQSRTHHLESLLAAANATIDRLLAFVPARAAALPAERLAVLADIVVDSTRARVPGAENVAVTVTPEQDPNVSASHRLGVRFHVPTQTDLSALAQQIQGIFTDLAGQTTGEEFESLRLLIDPEFA